MPITPGSTTAAGSALAISVAAPATQDAAGYAALTFTDIGLIDKIGSIGSSFAKVEFKPLKGATQKFKGSVDYGTLQPSLAYDETDAGQVLLRTAGDNLTALYSFMVTYPNGAKRYFQGRVFGNPETVDGPDSVLLSSPSIEVSTAIIKA
jgi:hypothetical protein